MIQTVEIKKYEIGGVMSINISSVFPFNGSSLTSSNVIDCIGRAFWISLCICILPVTLPLYLASSLYNFLASKSISQRSICLGNENVTKNIIEPASVSEQNLDQGKYLYQKLYQKSKR